MTLPMPDRQAVRQELERRILHGLACEWEMALQVLSPQQQRLMRKPLFGLRDLNSKWGYWSCERNEICISRGLVLSYSWDSVREVLLHEMAHQMASQVLGADGQSSHGSLFRQACHLLRANPKASGYFRPLQDRMRQAAPTAQDRILMRIQKLMALAESQNPYEAEAAMLKAHELIAKYNLKLLAHRKRTEYISVFLGTPALRHPKEDYFLASLLQDFYFVYGIWVSAYVLDKQKMGRVLEISGTLQNVKIASYVYDVIQQYIYSQWSAYHKAKRPRHHRKSDFAVGIIEGFRSKLESHARRDTAADSDFAVIHLADPGLEHYCKYRYPSTRRINKSVSHRNATVLNDGKKLGKRLVVAKGIAEKGDDRIRLITNN